MPKSSISQLFTDRTHHLLLAWSGWARNHRLGESGENVLSKLIRRREQDFSEGTDTPLDFSPEIEAVDKAVARLRHEKDKRLRKFVMRYYLGRNNYLEIATALNSSEPQIRELHTRAVMVLKRHIDDVQNDMEKRRNSLRNQ